MVKIFWFALGGLKKRGGVVFFGDGGAWALLQKKRQGEFSSRFVAAMVAEAQRLGVARQELLDMVALEFDRIEKG